MSDNKDDMSLDDILASIRSVVMDERGNNTQKIVKLKSAENQSQNTNKHQTTTFDTPIEDGSLQERLFNNKQHSQPQPTMRQSAEQSIIKQVQTDVNQTISTTAGNVLGLDMTEQKKSQVSSENSFDTAPTQLSDIIEVGNPNAQAPMLSGRAAFDVEESIREIIDILNQNKQQLPPEFFARQEQFIKTWLNGYLPEIVEKIVQKEISRIFKYVYKNQ